MSKLFDDVIKDWGERKDYGKVRGRKGPNIRGKKTGSSAASSGASGGGAGSKRKLGGMTSSTNFRTTRLSSAAKFRGLVKRVPEVVVKVTGGAHNLSHLKNHLDYISRNGKLDLEDENSDVHLGLDQVNEVRDAWGDSGYRIPRTGEQKREALNLVLSMPPGTNSERLTAAARAFATERFSKHQYVFATHDDKDHTHVHLTVKKVDREGMRLNPRKADLQEYREHFAEKLAEQGIQANATRRFQRGITRKAERAVIRQIDGRGGESRRMASWQKDVENEIATGVKRSDPVQAVNAERAAVRVSRTRDRELKEYGRIARALASSPDVDDRQLALDVVSFVRDMPSTKTRHELAVDAARNHTPAGGADRLRREPYINADRRQTPGKDQSTDKGKD